MGGLPEVFEADQYFYHPDHLGSSSYVTDIDGEIFQHLEYFPFGETWLEESSNTQRTPYLFTGKELDEQTGLYYFGARYYDPRTSVWQSPDPILASYMGGGPSLGVFKPANINLYGYVRQNPVRLVDPNGLWGQCNNCSLGEWLVDQAFRGVHASSVWLFGSEENVQTVINTTADFTPVIGAIKGVQETESAEGTAAVIGLELLGPLGDLGRLGANSLKQADNVVDVGQAVARACSFHADTLILTANGLVPISEVAVGTLVWSRDPATGQMGWKRVLAQYANLYDETVYVSIRDAETGAEQVIISNLIHPFFVQRGSVEGMVPVSQNRRQSSEGHVYRGPIAGGAWVDASKLQPGDRLLNADGSWAIVLGVDISEKELQAFNLTVDGFSTYFASGSADAHSVWVHNACFKFFEGARNRALEIVDEAGGINPATRTPHIGRLGEQRGRVTGFDARMNDGRPVQFRLDFDPDMGAHINVVIGKGNNRVNHHITWEGSWDDVLTQMQNLE